ncbi:penicillin-insensitive murein endopeptidase [Methylocucumis oryzae]|uniref:penicillin-insensitive murein endopeptidase n=1 Tax=Methylocucumis oryzae TaxID=1632867 RepID=UPI000AD54200
MALLTRLILFIIVSYGSNLSANPWSQQTKPALLEGKIQSIGTYTNGCLAGADTLPINGQGYQVMRLSRQRFYGHPDLIQFIQKLGLSTQQQGLGTLLIGDLGQVRGGPTVSGHRSHQTGLDVDIWFMLSKHPPSVLLTEQERENWSAASMLKGNTDAINLREWTKAQVNILEAAARMPEVDRIFVNPSIKRELCLSQVQHDWLRKIRPWWKHEDHFHVRLKCPSGNRHCQSQEPLPAGDGCDAGLAWWFFCRSKKT